VGEEKALCCFAQNSTTNGQLPCRPLETSALWAIILFRRRTLLLASGLQQAASGQT